ncbi:MAG TPA: GNAT family N-acetyltransferase [Rhodanobacteraceae bacterium]|nr:GNAT family N-acetyltransferase [Rhodanobacteraceae bacterium]
MSVDLRDVREPDLDAVLALNNGAGAAILPLDAASLRYFFEQADYFRVAEIDGRIAGFLIALREDADHASSNFRWFRERFARFVYVDRVVIGDGYRGHGLGRVFYSDVQSYAEAHAPVLACEVFLEPRDDVSMLFHGTRGFNEVGQQAMPENGRRVCLLAKQLECHAFVCENYPQGLPAMPRLASRLRTHVEWPRAATGGA